MRFSVTGGVAGDVVHLLASSVYILGLPTGEALQYCCLLQFCIVASHCCSAGSFL